MSLSICPCCHDAGVIPEVVYSVDAEKLILEAMRDYPLKAGEALFLGPASIAYLIGDCERAPWISPHVKAPNGRKLPDQWVTDVHDWAKLIVAQGVIRNKATRKS